MRRSDHDLDPLLSLFAQRFAIRQLVELDAQILGQYQLIRGLECSVDQDVDVVHVIVGPVPAVTHQPPVLSWVPNALTPHHVLDAQLTRICHEEGRDLVAIIDALWIAPAVGHHHIEGLATGVVHDRVLSVAANHTFIGVIGEQVLQKAQEVDSVGLEPCFGVLRRPQLLRYGLDCRGSGGLFGVRSSDRWS